MPHVSLFQRTFTHQSTEVLLRSRLTGPAEMLLHGTSGGEPVMLAEVGPAEGQHTPLAWREWNGHANS